MITLGAFIKTLSGTKINTPKGAILCSLALVFMLSSCANKDSIDCHMPLQHQWANSAHIIDDIRTLSSAEFAGRKTGSEGAILSQNYLEQRFTALGLQPWQSTFKVPFTYKYQFSQQLGVNIVKKACFGPFKAIIENAGKSAEAIYAQVENDKTSEFIGYDARNSVVCDMFTAGIIDPTKVTRTALELATSGAGILLTTECVINIDPTDEKKETPNYEY